MTIQFRKESYTFTYLDPRKNFEESPISLEVRFDPLLNRTTQVYGTQMRGYLGLAQPDLKALVEKSRQGCPFCPQNLEAVTPQFPPSFWPQGRIVLGEARVFPNMMPYAPYCAIGVFSTRHFYDLPDFTPPLLAHGLAAAQVYFKRVMEFDRRVRYAYLAWNHLPPSGGSIFHPHLQLLASYGPTNRHQEMLQASRRYLEETGQNFWSEFIHKERELGERYLGSRGRVHWLVPFAPKGRFVDVMAVCEGSEGLLEARDQEDLAWGLVRVFRYLHDQGFFSFNFSLSMCLQPGEPFFTQARIIPRATLGPMEVSDYSFLELLQDQPGTLKPPEETCRELKEYFGHE